MSLEIISAEALIEESVPFWMTSTFWIAITGVLGTLAGSVLTPLVQAHANGREIQKREDRATRRDALQRIQTNLTSFARLDSHKRASSPEWLASIRGYNSAVDDLSHVLTKRDRELLDLLSIASPALSNTTTPLDDAVSRSSQAALSALLNGWQRGEIKTKGILKEYHDRKRFFYRHNIEYLTSVNGVWLYDDMLTPEQMQERTDLNISFPRPITRSKWKSPLRLLRKRSRRNIQ